MKLARISLTPEHMGGMAFMLGLRISTGEMVADCVSAAESLASIRTSKGKNDHGTHLFAIETVR